MTKGLAAALVLAAGMLAVPGAAPTTAPSTVVLLVRHAEKAPGTGDVPLSEAGQARARVVAEVARQAGVQAIVTTQFKRTQQTAALLVSGLAIVPEVVGAQADVAKHAADVASAVRRHAGEVVLVVGHSNTIPPIVAALGGTSYANLCDAEYDALFIVVVDPEGTVRTVRTRFGAPTPVSADCALMGAK